MPPAQTCEIDTFYLAEQMILRTMRSKRLTPFYAKHTAAAAPLPLIPRQSS